MSKLRNVLFLIYYIPIGLPIFVLWTALISTLIALWAIMGWGAWGARHFGRAWGRVNLWLHWSPIEIVGREHLPHLGQTYVVIANHQSAFDIYALYGYVDIPFKWVLKEELRRVPLVGWACHEAGFIFVDDSKPSSISHTMAEARRVLSEGSSIFIFPEGSRSEDGSVQKFKKGAFMMAAELDVPLLPVTIDGAFDILPRDKYIARPHRIRLTVHPPIKVSDFGTFPANVATTAREAQRTIASALEGELNKI